MYPVTCKEFERLHCPSEQHVHDLWGKMPLGKVRIEPKMNVHPSWGEQSILWVPALPHQQQARQLLQGWKALGRVRGAWAVTGILLACSVSFQAHGLIPSHCAATVPPWCMGTSWQPAVLPVPRMLCSSSRSCTRSRGSS